MRVAAVQTLPAPGDLAKSVRDHARLVARAAQQGASLVVFPELSLSGYDRGLTRAHALSASDPRLTPLQQAADLGGVALIAGAPVQSPEGLLIGALCYAPGRAPITYSKRFLHEGEEIAFVAGRGGLPLQMQDRLVCIAICAEIAHAEHAQEAAERGADVYAASCFITPAGYAHDSALLEGYARAHRMVVVMANYGAATGGWMSAGGSAIWSAEGNLLARGPDEGEAVVVATVELGRGQD
jgi:predicted amidohydrolase